MYTKNPPERLKYAREKSGYTQDEASRETKITRSCIAKYERGINQPNLEMLCVLAEAYNTTPNWLLSFEENKKS